MTKSSIIALIKTLIFDQEKSDVKKNIPEFLPTWKYLHNRLLCHFSNRFFHRTP